MRRGGDAGGDECLPRPGARRGRPALNAAYRALIARLGADSPLRAPLTEAQRARLRFRDAECAFATAGSRGGSFHPAAQSGCLLGLTRQRLEALQAYLNCGEGDLACPVPPAGR
ncbi:lysozyme inhibitor LprI family protein [Teichococcus aestuarii]|uniref:lysozyme inhibitor LprI family protein n=1 Tax=Teichococcus aestuarii TaxID=568898 RepID=UPI00360CC854